MSSRPRTVLALAALSLLALPTMTMAASSRRTAPTRSQNDDYQQRFDANQLGMVVTNVGSFAWDIMTGSGGLEFPRGSGNTMVFAAGLWLGGRVAAQPRVTVAEYSWEWGPGSMVGGVADDAGRPEYKVYKLLRHYPDVPSRDAALADYVAGAVPHGAPPVAVLADGSLDLPGEQALWCVFNDADPALHTALPGGTAPLGVEVRQRVWGETGPAPLDRTVFIEYTLLNAGANLIDDTRVGLWFDPDLGGASDDLVGCLPSANLGFAYNATNADLFYGSTPPALGVDLLRGPNDDAGHALPLAAFVGYLNGTDPTSAVQSDHGLHGLLANGNPIVDPTTLSVTTFMYPGDPVAPSGWVDTTPADRRMLLVTGPFTLAPGAWRTLRFALIVSRGTDRFDSLERLQVDDAVVQQMDDGGPTAIEVSLAEARLETGDARLVWSVGGTGSARYRVERAIDTGDWAALGEVVPDGTGLIRYRDPGLDPGHRYGYRLLVTDAEGARVAGEGWLEFPARRTFALAGARPNPVTGRLTLAFSLPDAAPARLELLDLAGRVLRRVEVGALGSGAHTVDLGSTSGLPAGLYLARLVGSAGTRVMRVSVIR